MPAASVGVARPARIEPSVAAIRPMSGTVPTMTSTQHDRQRMHALLDRHRRAELRIDERARHQVRNVDPGQQEARSERGGIEVGDRYAEHRSHHDQHHRRRNQNPERAAGGDGAGRQAGVVAGLDHDRRGHDAEHGHRRADDAGRHREHGRCQDDDQIERAAHRRQQQAERREQSLHQPGLLGHVAHEDEQRHRRQQLLLHQADDLEIGEIENRAAHAEITEYEREEEQREGDRDADEDRPQQHQQHDQADERVGASYLDLFLVLELDAGADHVEALEEFGDALDDQQAGRPAAPPP